MMGFHQGGASHDSSTWDPLDESSTLLLNVYPLIMNGQAICRNVFRMPIGGLRIEVKRGWHFVFPIQNRTERGNYAAKSLGYRAQVLPIEGPLLGRQHSSFQLPQHSLSAPLGVSNCPLLSTGDTRAVQVQNHELRTIEHDELNPTRPHAAHKCSRTTDAHTDAQVTPHTHVCGVPHRSTISHWLAATRPL